MSGWLSDHTVNPLIIYSAVKNFNLKLLNFILIWIERMGISRRPLLVTVPNKNVSLAS